MLLYLNPDWKAGDGGELVLCPFMDTPVVIEPLMDRVVIFRVSHVGVWFLLSHKFLRRILGWVVRA
jgi:hypothetical protein